MTLSWGFERGAGAVEPSPEKIQQVGRECCCSPAATRDKPAWSPGNGRNYNPPDRQNPLHERTHREVKVIFFSGGKNTGNDERGKKRSQNKPPRDFPLSNRIIPHTLYISFLAAQASWQPLITPVLPQPTPIAGRHIPKGRRSRSRHGRCRRNRLHHLRRYPRRWWRRI